jgi:hypothetical protein
MKAFGVVLVFVSTLTWAQAQSQEPGPITQPSVGRSVLICDQWQWIGNGAVTWGCLTLPRRVTVAGGVATDEVVTSLQNQINELKSQLEALKSGRSEN